MGAFEDLRQMLTGGDRRSLGRSAEAVALMRERPEYSQMLVGLLCDSDVVVCMRAADVLEKLSRESGSLLQPFAAELLGLMAEARQQEIRWHLASIVPRLELTPVELGYAAGILESYLDDHSSIVKTFAMQGLWELSRKDAQMRSRIVERIQELARTGTPAMRARGRKLLNQQNL
jgi:hypothetical protein